MLVTRSQWIPHIRKYETPPKAPPVSLSKNIYPHSLVLVGFKNGFKVEFKFERWSLWQIAINGNYVSSSSKVK